MKRNFVLAAACVLIASPTGAAGYIANGDFEGGFHFVPPDDDCPNAWSMFETSPQETSILTFSLKNGPSATGVSSLHWSRTQGGASGDWTVAEQDLAIDVSACDQCLLFTLDIKAMSHNLGGSGWTSGEWEYPVTVIVYFTDTDGNARFWQHGWYIWIDGATGPPPSGVVVADGMGIVYSQQVAAHVWLPMSFDLLGRLRTLAEPHTITKIRIGGSGWDFEGQADNLAIYNPISIEPTSWTSIKSLYR